VESTGGEPGKTEFVEVNSTKAQVEDLLQLFTTSNPPALRGPITLQAHITVPPGRQQFLKKVHLNGEFEIPKAEFIHKSTQVRVNELSNRARGKKRKQEELADELIPSSFEARVDLKDGIAAISSANFKTRGARASGEGTYSLLTRKIDLRGRLAIEASLSKAAGGFKSLFLLPLDPFFRKGNAGAVVPIHVAGTYPHPSFKISLKDHK
jgi:hypothetical protein